MTKLKIVRVVNPAPLPGRWDENDRIVAGTFVTWEEPLFDVHLQEITTDYRSTHPHFVQKLVK